MSRTEIKELPDSANLLTIYKKHRDEYLYTLKWGEYVLENYRIAMLKFAEWRPFDFVPKKRAFDSALINILSRFPQFEVKVKKAESREAESPERTKTKTPDQETVETVETVETEQKIQERGGSRRTRRSKRSRRSRRTRRTRRSRRTRR